MPELDLERLLTFSNRLQGVSSFTALLEVVCSEVELAVGFRAVWVALVEPDRENVRILFQRGGNPWDEARIIPIVGDVHLGRVFTSRAPVVVEDAQVDPDVNREIVQALGNRTIVNVPMSVLDEPFGALGMGTFRDEGVRVPTDAQLAYLQALANQVVVATSRLLLTQERERSARERARMERLMSERQRVESLGQLAGGLAHDFNNLLTVISSAASLLREGETNPGRLSDVEMIREAAERGAELTSRLLALGKRQTLQVLPTDANDVLRKVIALVRRVVRADIAIDFTEGRELPAVSADASQLQQVFMNLCLNARDAMPEGGRLTLLTERVEIDDEFVRMHPWSKAGKYVLATLTDSGTGMAPEVLDRIFEPFFTTKEEGRGTGLGLAVSRGIVEQHGGFIHAYSEVGVGTTFRVYLPVANALADEIAVPSEPPLRTGNERILVADDQKYVRDVVERVLVRAGYSVTCAPDGRSAIECARATPFDLVILDAVMPGIGGREAYGGIRDLRPGVPVLFASGYGGDELTTRFLTDIDAEFLPKPFDPGTLLRTVRRLLDESAARQRTAPSE